MPLSWKGNRAPITSWSFFPVLQRQESFEVQIKVPIADNASIIAVMESGALDIVKYSHYRQFDHYFYFSDARSGCGAAPLSRR